MEMYFLDGWTWHMTSKSKILLFLGISINTNLFWQSRYKCIFSHVPSTGC